MCKTTQFITHIDTVRRRRIHIGLTEYYHSDIAVQVNLPRLRAHEPQMDQIPQPLRSPFQVLVLAIRRHVECALTDERLRIRRHIAQIVHYNEHLHNGSQRIEECHLDGARFRHVVPLLPEIDVSLQKSKLNPRFLAIFKIFRTRYGDETLSLSPNV